jgi:hypothetical protein
MHWIYQRVVGSAFKPEPNTEAQKSYSAYFFAKIASIPLFTSFVHSSLVVWLKLVKGKLISYYFQRHKF